MRHPHVEGLEGDLNGNVFMRSEANVYRERIRTTGLVPGGGNMESY